MYNYSMDKEQLIERIQKLKQEESYYNAMQTALKLTLNGSYGAFGNEFFVCSNNEIAGAITAMGRNLIQYMDRCNQEYWYLLWHEDVELHEKLGIKDVKPISQTWVWIDSNTVVDPSEFENSNEFIKHVIEGSINRQVPVSIYCDTDSLFVGFEPGMESCNWKGDPKEFINLVNKHRLADFFKKKLEAYAKKYKVNNIQDFELERINESILFLAKKMYIQHVAWEDGIDYERMTYLYPKGVKMIKSDTPPFAREKILEIVTYLMSNPKDYSIKNMLKYVRDIKKQFKMADIEDISMTISCNGYKAHVLDDTEHMRFVEPTFWAIKMAAFHNHLLFLNEKYQNKYDKIQDGTKMKWYYCKHPDSKRFSYTRGSYPIEYAPEVDYDTQFEKTILNQVNAYVEALGLPELNKRLSVVLPLF